MTFDTDGLTSGVVPIAVVGYGCVFPPDSYDPQRYWRALMAGRSGISPPHPDRWQWPLYYSPNRAEPDKTYCRLGGFIRDWVFPDDGPTQSMNRTQQLVVHTTRQAVGGAGLSQDDIAGPRTGLFVGNMLGDETFGDESVRRRCADLLAALRDSDALQGLPAASRAHLLAKLEAALADRLPPKQVDPLTVLPSGLVPRIAEVLGVVGPSFLIDAACASGLMVVDVAARYLADNSLDTVVASGVMANMSVTGNVSFAKIGGLSATTSRPFDAAADGLIPGEGAGTVILQRYAHAVASGRPIHAVITSAASRSDGRGAAIYAPSSRGQHAAMAAALAAAGLQPRQVDRIETHATATVAGDAVEIESILELVGTATLPTPISLGSVKALIGHTFPAAGMANLLSAVLALHHQQLPPVHGVRTVHPRISARPGCLSVPTAPTPWPAADEFGRVALINAFGFGGINSCVTLSDHPPSSYPPSKPPPAPLAVLGLGVLVPGVTGVADLEHQDGIEQPTVTGWEFGWRELRIPPATVAEMDRAQQLALDAARQALLSYSEDPQDWRAGGVVVGSCAGLAAAAARNFRIRSVEYTQALTDVAAGLGLRDTLVDALAQAISSTVDAQVLPTTENALPGYMDSIVAGRVANVLDLRGPALVVDDAGTSFASAVDIAARQVGGPDCPIALVGAVHANRTPEFVDAYAEATGSGPLAGAEGAVFLVVCRAEEIPQGARALGLIHVVRECPGDDAAPETRDSAGSSTPSNSSPALSLFAADHALAVARALLRTRRDGQARSVAAAHGIQRRAQVIHLRAAAVGAQAAMSRTERSLPPQLHRICLRADSTSGLVRLLNNVLETTEHSHDPAPGPSAGVGRFTLTISHTGREDLVAKARLAIQSLLDGEVLRAPTTMEETC